MRRLECLPCASTQGISVGAQGRDLQCITRNASPALLLKEYPLVRRGGICNASPGMTPLRFYKGNFRWCAGEGFAMHHTECLPCASTKGIPVGAQGRDLQFVTWNASPALLHFRLLPFGLASSLW